jgi:hypothetical protein
MAISLKFQARVYDNSGMANLPNIPNLHDGCFDGLWLSGDKENTGTCLFVRAAMENNTRSC